MDSIPFGIFLFLGLPSLLLIICGIAIYLKESVHLSEFRHQTHQPHPVSQEVSGDIAKVIGVTLIIIGTIFLLLALSLAFL